MEEEVRQTICQAVETPESIPAVFSKFFGAKNGIDLSSAINEHRQPHEPMDFQS